jgi:AcrR family transcriptional regulator
MAGLGERRAARVLEAAFRLASEPGLPPLSVREVAGASGVPPRSILYWYGDAETLCRLAVARQAAALAAPLSWSPPPGIRPRDAIAGFARICAKLFASEAYRRLAFLLMRDGPSRPWLVALHRQEVIEPVQAGLARIVREAGGSAEIRSSGTRAFAERLQRELALPMLLPRQKGPSTREMMAIAAEAADAAMKSVYRPGTIAAALGQLVRQPGPRSPRLLPLSRRAHDIEAAA